MFSFPHRLALPKKKTPCLSSMFRQCFFFWGGGWVSKWLVPWLNTICVCSEGCTQLPFSYSLETVFGRDRACLPHLAMCLKITCPLVKVINRGLNKLPFVLIKVLDGVCSRMTGTGRESIVLIWTLQTCCLIWLWWVSPSYPCSYILLQRCM